MRPQSPHPTNLRARAQPTYRGECPGRGLAPQRRQPERHFARDRRHTTGLSRDLVARRRMVEPREPPTAGPEAGLWSRRSSANLHLTSPVSSCLVADAVHAGSEPRTRGAPCRPTRLPPNRPESRSSRAERATSARTRSLSSTTAPSPTPTAPSARACTPASPGHSFVLIDADGHQRWYGEYPSMWLDPTEFSRKSATGSPHDEAVGAAAPTVHATRQAGLGGARSRPSEAGRQTIMKVV